MPSDALLTRRAFAALGGALLAPGVPFAQEAAPVAAPPSRAALRQDGDLVERAFGALHPGLLRYNTPAQLDRHFDVLRGELEQAAASADWLASAYLALSRLTAKIRCGHTYANFYNQSVAVRRRLFEGADKLPCEFRWVDDRMVVTRDLSVERCLPRGTSITAVGAVPTPVLLRRLMPLVRADGANDAKRIALLELQGRDRYETFDVLLALTSPNPTGVIALDIVLPDGTRRHVTPRALDHAERLKARGVAPDDAQAGWRLEVSDPDLAVLRMPSWALYDSKWDWKAFIANSFASLADHPKQALVIDLRGNEGGLDIGDALLPYLSPRPIAADAVPRLVRYRDVPPELEPFLDTWDPSFRHWGDAARRVDDRFFALAADGAETDAGTVVPREPRFPGKVFVLIGPDNSSATFQFAERVRATGLATLVGRPTGGNRRGINGGAFFFLRLPASGLEIDLPLIARFPSGSPPDAGLLPDVPVAATARDLQQGIDVEMSAVRRMLA